MTRPARHVLLTLSLLAVGSLALAGFLAASTANVTGTGPLGLTLRGDIDHLVLRNLKLTYRIDKGRTGDMDLSFLAALPTVRRLEIQDAEIRVTFEGGPQRIDLMRANLTIADFSPSGGGSVAVDARFALAGDGEAPLAAHGTLSGSFQLAGVSSRPHGIGTLRAVVDSGRYTLGGRPVMLDGLSLRADLAYDPRTATVALNALRVEGSALGLGTVEGTAQAVLRDERPWRVTLSAPAIDLGQVFAALKVFLPNAYAGWTAQGHGGVAARVQGTLGSDGLAFEGTVTGTLAQVGFGSPDGTTAAQGVNAGVWLQGTYAAAQQKLAFVFRAEQRDGEVLRGGYYSNLAGRRASLQSEGDLFFGDTWRFALSGTLDAFQTGAYAFDGRGDLDAWVLNLKAHEISHAAVEAAVLKEYLEALSPALADVSVTGSSFLDARLEHDHGATAITGEYRMSGTRLDAPRLRLSIGEMTAHLPFALQYPPVEAREHGPRHAGFFRLQALQRGRLIIESVLVPVVISQNRLEVPEPISIPFFGGDVRVVGFQIDDVLFPTRYRFGLNITDVDLGRMSRRLTSVDIPGRLNADLGMMRYENNRIASEGRALATVFGGEIEATELFVDNPASPSRKFGGNILFRNINLEELTTRIPVGRMTGVIQGSLENLTIEYGEPASFVLEIQSVPTPGVPQTISVDAIQNISILGTGADSALNRGITQLFKEYPYSRIGLRLALKNDQFSVNGTIHEGGKEYLVRRGLLRGVDVVNQNPDNVISFRDMTERMKRLAQPPEIRPGTVKIE